eukprot:12502680-Ditylum_brightwellii.AAC.1
MTASTTPKTRKRKTKWIRVQKAEVIKCYYLALHKRILIVKSTYELWQGRQDQTGFRHVTAASLASMHTYAMNSDQFSTDELQQLQDDAIRIELPSDSGTTPVSEE